MSTGRVICSICKRDTAQEWEPDKTTGRRRWFHRDDGSDLCEGGRSIYADDSPPMMMNYYPSTKETQNDPT